MKKIIIAVLAVLLVAPIIGIAAEIRTGDQVSLTGTLDSGDFYAAGGNVSVSANIIGDLTIAGGTISVTGSTTEDVIAAGGTIMLRGSVGDDIRAAGGNIVVGGPVANDIVIAGGQVVVDAVSDIGGDAIIGGGAITIDGRIHGRARLTGGQVLINGIIDQDVSIKADKIVIGSEAVISGNLNYSSPVKAEIMNGAVISGETNYTPISRAGKAASGVGAFIGWFIGGFFIVFVSAFVLYLVFRRPVVAVVNEALGTFWKSVLTGFIVLVVAPVGALLLCITVLGLPLGIMAIFSYIVLIILSFLLSPVVAGSYLYRWITKSDKNTVDWQTIALGVLALMIVSLIPIIGWIVRFILILAVLGTISKRLYGLFIAKRPDRMEPEITEQEQESSGTESKVY